MKHAEAPECSAFVVLIAERTMNRERSLVQISGRVETATLVGK
jgi:hypothetical protein